MSDLTDERIAELVTHWGGYAIEERATRTALLELQRHRAAQAADEERVRSVVREAAMRFAPAAIDESLADAIATRAAKQLASAAPGELPLWAKFAIQKMHDMVDQTDPDDPIGVALTRAGLEGRPE